MSKLGSLGRLGYSSKEEIETFHYPYYVIWLQKNGNNEKKNIYQEN